MKQPKLEPYVSIPNKQFTRMVKETITNDDLKREWNEESYQIGFKQGTESVLDRLEKGVKEAYPVSCGKDLGYEAHAVRGIKTPTGITMMTDEESAIVDNFLSLIQKEKEANG